MENTKTMSVQKAVSNSILLDVKSSVKKLLSVLLKNQVSRKTIEYCNCIIYMIRASRGTTIIKSIFIIKYFMYRN